VVLDSSFLRPTFVLRSRVRPLTRASNEPGVD